MSKPTLATRLPRHDRWPIVLVGAIGLLVLLLLGYQAWQGHQDALRAAETRSRNDAAMLEAQLDGALRRTEAVLNSVALALPAAALDPARAEPYRRAVQRDLATRLMHFPEVSRVRIFDTQGRSLHTSDADLQLNVSIADRRYFDTLRRKPDAGLQFSELLTSRTNGKRTLIVAHGLHDEARAFRGVAVAVLELEHFEQQFRALDLGRGGVVAVRRLDDHSVVVRWPPLPAGAASAIRADTPTARLAQAGPKAATYEAFATSDQVRRIYTLRRLDRYPFYVNVGLSRDEALAGWRQRTGSVALATLLLMGLLAVGLVRLWRSDTRAAHALAESEASESRYRSVVAALGEGIVLMDERGSIVAANAAAERILGLSAEELQGRKSVDPRWQAVREDGEPFRGEDHPASVTLRTGQAQAGVVMGVHTPDGRKTWISINSEPIFSHGQTQPTAVVASFADITARKQAELALRDRELLFRTLAQASPVGIFRTNAEGDCTYVNEKHLQIAGLTEAQTLGRGWMAALHPDDRERVGRLWAQAMQRGEPFGAEYRFIRPDGHVTWVVGQAQRDPVSGDWVGTITDISERRQHETALAQLASELEHRVQERTADLEAAKREAERANRVKSEFLSAMSHELRTPLNAILGFGQLLAADPRQPLPPQHAGYVHEILSAGRHLLDLIGEVLDLASIEAGKLPLQPGTVSVAAAVADCLKLVLPAAQLRRIRIDAPVPEDAHAHVHADRTRLKQVLLNLLSNAIKYNREGGTVQVRCVRDGQALRIEVADSGAGLSSDEQERLFRDFERLGAHKGRIEGTGVGLALSKRLVELMGGRIGVASHPGEGSTFWVSLPLAPVDAAPAPAEPAAAPAPAWRAPVPPGADRTVLYIEDDPVNTRLMSALIARVPGLRLLNAHAPGAGLDLAHAERPDLILLDLQLPGLDGFEVLRQLRAMEATAHTPVIAVSANATHDSIERATQAGFADYVTKPVDVARLMDAMARVFGAQLSSA